MYRDDFSRFKNDNPEEYSRMYKFTEDTFNRITVNKFDSKDVVKGMCINYPDPPRIKNLSLASSFGMILYDVSENDGGWNCKSGIKSKIYTRK